MQNQFHEAWLNSSGRVNKNLKHVVYGMHLKPLCALHIVALEALDSPFPFAQRDSLLEDFVAAAIVLSQDYAHLEIEPPDLASVDLRAMAKAAGVKTAKQYNQWREDENKKLDAYFRDYWSLPPMERIAGGDSPVSALGAPWLLGTIVALLRQTNLTEERLWRMPMGQLLWYACVTEEQVSDSRIIDQERLDLRARADAEYEVYLAAKKKREETKKQ